MECVLILALGIFLSAPPVEEVRKATADVYRSTDLQAQFPQVAPEPERSAPKGLHVPDPARSVASVLLWTLALVALAVAVVYVTQRLGGYTADIELAPGDAEAGAFVARAPPPADEARQLAAEGRLEEAIHLLLLLALHPLTEERHLAGSLTSREIIRSVELPEAARDAVEGLRLAVEISLFGGQPPTRDDFETCARQFERYCASLGVVPA